MKIEILYWDSDDSETKQDYTFNILYSTGQTAYSYPDFFSSEEETISAAEELCKAKGYETQECYIVEHC